LQTDQAPSCGEVSLALYKKQKVAKFTQTIKCCQGVAVKWVEVSCVVSDTEKFSVAGTRTQEFAYSTK